MFKPLSSFSSAWQKKTSNYLKLKTEVSFHFEHQKNLHKLAVKDAIAACLLWNFFAVIVYKTGIICFDKLANYRRGTIIIDDGSF